jgi:hypothetical protein
MRSDEHSRSIDLERDLPTTAEDVAALRRVKEIPPIDLESYLRFLASLPLVSTQDAVSRRRVRPMPPFDLMG